MNVLIVDDEPLARDRLRRMLEQVDGCSPLEEEGRNGLEAVELAQKHNPDVVLMDIRMPNMNGLEAARHLCEMECPPAVIFCTAYGEYALEAFDVQAVGYLLKPVKQSALVQALQNAKKTNRSQLNAINQFRPGEQPGKRSHISAKTYKGVELIPLNEVRYFIADNKYVTVNHTKGEVLIDETLKELETEFEGAFVRIHRNALVAKGAIEGMSRNDQGGYEVRLKGVDEPLLISRRHVAGMRKLLQTL
ncbi:LytR/AlgR family response regulator transcription factor [Spartinivicinus ruber]|uniref:LytR/AlgR family response regulator transcription factor n=1 Tax=Spartinivicinus ruber TaxID=2683272 RepID=UPI0013D06DB3|nr:LytTR family DNA-binding domain-containing protein [Spartinivicinus ruber]